VFDVEHEEKTPRVRLWIRATLPADAPVDRVRLDGRSVHADERGHEPRPRGHGRRLAGREHTLMVTTR
jgi:hypothetical protein